MEDLQEATAALAWPGTGCCDYLGSELMDKRVSLTHTHVCTLSLNLTSKKKKKLKKKKVSKPINRNERVVIRHKIFKEHVISRSRVQAESTLHYTILYNT